MKALKRLVADERVGTLTPVRSLHGRSITPLTFAADLNNIQALKLIVGAIVSPKHIERKPLPEANLDVQTTGSYSMYTYGHAVRSFSASRQSKEGNSALMYALSDEDVNFGEEIMKSQTIKKEAFELLRVSLPGDRFSFEEHIISAVENGNFELAGAAIANVSPFCDFNNLHKEVLTHTTEPLTPYRNVSIPKKPQNNFGVLP
jgi:hypothetical protein